MDKVLVLHNKELDFGVFKDQYESYVSAFENIGISAKAMPTSEILSSLFEYELKSEIAIYLDKDVNCAILLESKGFKLYNSAESIRLCDDKALTYIKLRENELPIPKTIIAPKTYKAPVNKEWCRNAAERLGFPLVVKECFGSLGNEVYLVNNIDEMVETVEKIGNRPFVVQEFLKNAYGWDVRVIVVDGEVIGAVKRINNKDFRANAAQGGQMEIFHLSRQDEMLAIGAAKATGTFFAGVDLIMGESGFAVCEVNSNMLFSSAEKTLGISIAGKIAEKIKSNGLNK